MAERAEAMPESASPKQFALFGWWILSFFASLLSMVVLAAGRAYYYFAEENPSALMGRHVGDPPEPEMVWVLFAGVAIGLLILGFAYFNRAENRHWYEGWSPAVKRLTAATTLIFVVAFISGGVAAVLVD